MGDYGNATSSGPPTSTYSVDFDGKIIETVVTNKASVIDRWVSEILWMCQGRWTMVVGLDVEWKPNYTPASRTDVNTPPNPPATLQLCVNLKCLIIQLIHVDYIPDSLKNFLMNPNFVFVGVEVGSDIAKLRNSYGLNCRNHVDLQEEAMRQWPGRYQQRPGLKNLAFDVAGIFMEKPHYITMSNWAVPHLSVSQVRYATIDAYASYKTGYELLMQY